MGLTPASRVVSRSAGFTLIELLVVIGILALLSGVLYASLSQGNQAAERFADQANLRWHYQVFTDYHTSHGHKLPPGTGHRFVLEPWVSRSVQRTPENFERYWTPGLPSPRREALELLDMEKVWDDRSALDSDDTQYAGPSAELKQQRLFGNETLPLMANDNEHGPAFLDHTINVLMGGGQVRTLVLDPNLIREGFDPSVAGATFPVGAGSPHEVLSRLEK